MNKDINTIYLDNIVNKLTDSEKRMIVGSINNCGTGQHPVAKVNGLKFFAVDYCIECIRKAVNDQLINPKYKKEFLAVVDKLLERG